MLAWGRIRRKKAGKVVVVLVTDLRVIGLELGFGQVERGRKKENTYEGEMGCWAQVIG